jgi:hypothetical protein
MSLTSSLNYPNANEAYAILSTTDASAHTIYSFILPPNSGCVLIITLVGVNTSTLGQSCAFPFYINKIAMASAGSTPSQSGLSTSVGAKLDASMTGAQPTFQFVAGGIVNINVQGPTVAQNVDWGCIIKFMYIT